MPLADPVDQLTRVDLLGALKVRHAFLRRVVTVAFDDRCQLDFFGRGCPHYEFLLCFFALFGSLTFAAVAEFLLTLHSNFISNFIYLK